MNEERYFFNVRIFYTRFLYTQCIRYCFNIPLTGMRVRVRPMEYLISYSDPSTLRRLYDSKIRNRSRNSFYDTVIGDTFLLRKKHAGEVTAL